MVPQTAAPAIILRPLPFPVEDARIAGYFGGTPTMPALMAWPRSRGGTPLLFVAQIDLRTVADWHILGQTTLPPPREDGHNFGDSSRVPIQMFGAGYLMQHAAVEHADKVLLFQLSEGFGLPVKLHHGILQVWIAPEDLAAGRFDTAFSTAECT